MLQTMSPRFARQKRLRRTGWLSVLFALAINVVLFMTMSLVNRSLEQPLPKKIPDAIEIFAAADDTPPPPPPPIEETPEEDDEPEPEVLEPMTMRPAAAALVPRMPSIETAADLELSPDVTDPVVEVAKGPVGPMSAGAVDQDPRRTFAPPLEYPRWARRANKEATALVRFIVGADGRMRDVRITRLDGDERFRGVILGWAKQWKYEPGVDKGRKVAVRCWKTIRLRLKD